MAISPGAITSRSSLGGVASRVLLHSTRCMLHAPFQPGLDTDFMQTIISATHHSMHLDEDIFPEPTTFKPERWLRDDCTQLNRYLTPYSRGSRACIGIK
jgi:hypothetical protein